MKTVRRPDAVLRAMVVAGWRLPVGTLVVKFVAHLFSKVYLANFRTEDLDYQHWKRQGIGTVPSYIVSLVTHNAGGCKESPSCIQSGSHLGLRLVDTCILSCWARRLILATCPRKRAGACIDAM